MSELLTDCTTSRIGRWVGGWVGDLPLERIQGVVNLARVLPGVPVLMNPPSHSGGRPGHGEVEFDVVSCIIPLMVFG